MAALVVITISLSKWFDFAEIGYILFVVPVITLTLLVRALMSNRPSRFAMLVSYCLVTLFMLKGADWCRMHGRWLLSGGSYREAVLAQAEPEIGDFRHIIWDEWGVAGSGTEAYLVFDPSDTLAERISNSKDGKMNQHVCGVWRTYHLQRQWYSVVFNTNEFWDGCE